MFQIDLLRLGSDLTLQYTHMNPHVQSHVKSLVKHYRDYVQSTDNVLIVQAYYVKFTWLCLQL